LSNRVFPATSSPVSLTIWAYYRRLQIRAERIYFAVIEEGQLQSGDSIVWESRAESRFTIADAMRLYNGQELPSEMLDRALQLKALPDSWHRMVMEARTPK